MADENTFLMAHAAVKENSGVEFMPKYILVVTWDNMVPYWESNGDQVRLKHILALTVC